MGRGIRNFQVCARCRNHGIRNMLKGHKKTCAYKQCDCEKCLVTRDRQNFIAREIAMHRYEIKNKFGFEDYSQQGLKLNLVRSRSEDDSVKLSTAISRRVLKRHRNSGEIRRDQMCSRCRNHGVIQLLRGHKNTCSYIDCVCAKCEITKRRREIMAKQIKDYRNLKPTNFTASYPENHDSFETSRDFKEDFKKTQFTDYEPIESRDMFFMVQSLFEKYANQSVNKKIQLIYAFAHLAKGNWSHIETALERGKRNFNLSRICLLERSSSEARINLKLQET